MAGLCAGAVGGAEDAAYSSRGMQAVTELMLNHPCCEPYICRLAFHAPEQEWTEPITLRCSHDRADAGLSVGPEALFGVTFDQLMGAG